MIFHTISKEIIDIFYKFLYADDTVMIEDSKEKIQRLRNEFDKVCERRQLKVNFGKGKVMVCSKSQRGEQVNLSLKGEILEEVDASK